MLPFNNLAILHGQAHRIALNLSFQQIKQMGLEQIHFAGGGSIATALAMSLANGGRREIVLVSEEIEVVNDINSSHFNRKYFPGVRLKPNIFATNDISSFKNAKVIFIAIPSVAVVDYLEKHRGMIPDTAIIVNLAKGFSKDRETIAGSLQKRFPNPVCTLKGPSFAREIINNLPTGLTLGYRQDADKKVIKKLFHESNVTLDFSHDIIGVELLSILKNIYAIAIGIVDAHFNSPNLRSLVLTKAFNEMRSVLIAFGGKKKTMFRYCGFGDFILTSLNDLSRNRTLGLIIGKGFFSETISEDVVLEGKIAVNIFCEEIHLKSNLISDFPIINELYKVFNEPYKIQDFIPNIMRGEVEFMDE